MEKVYAFLDNNKDNMVKMLSEWISIPSIVEQSDDAQMPYGKACADMMSKAIEDAKTLGFTLRNNHENQMVTIDLNDEEAKLGVACHLDVVEANPQHWSTDPWKAEVIDNRIYGRGASDNKGAGVAALFALAAIKHAGKKGNIRLYFGSAEEIGSPCFRYYTDHYVKKEDLPPMIVPDADDIAYGEWGMLKAGIKGRFEQTGEKRLISISSGEAFNIIPGTATAVICGVTDDEIAALKQRCNFAATREGDAVTIFVEGTSCHSSQPRLGDNAAIKLLNILTKLPFDGGVDEMLQGLKELYTQSSSYISENVNKDLLTFSLTGLYFENGELSTLHDSRYSYDISGEQIRNEMQKKCSTMQCDVEFMLIKEPHYVDKNSDFVKKLSGIYEAFTNEKSRVIEMRATTYASQTINGVAFGQFEGENIHSHNENISVENLMKTAKLLALAMHEFLKD
ncbi:MAG: Sapep family Mn(2+)-dependent dipeptidase [Clostridia bacterium]|nr:Sapep family Mn(2+)-dependent dipeptidase [Clostridia bacterium]